MRILNFRSSFIRLLLAFVILTLIALVSISLTIYKSYESRTLKENSIISEKMLLQTVRGTEFIWSWAKSYPFELYKNGYVFNAIYGKDVTIMDQYYANKVISNAISYSPFVESVYLYNANMLQVISSNSQVYSPAEFFDQGAIEMLSNKDLLSDYHFIPRKMEYNYFDKKINEEALSLVVTDTKEGAGEYPEGALILNMKISTLKELIQSVDSAENDSFIIIDNNGLTISHSTPGMFLRDLSGEKFIKDIIVHKNKSGYFTVDIDGKNSLVTFIRSDMLKWSFIRVVHNERIFEKTYGMRNLIIAYTVILFFIISAASIWLSWKFYSPIGSLAEKVKKDLGSTAEPKKKINELEYISQAYYKIIENSRQMQQRSRDNRFFIRHELLKSILLGTLSAWEDPLLQFKEAGIGIIPKGLMVYILRIDKYWSNFYKENNEKNRNLLRFAISNIAQEVTSEYYVNEAIDMEGDMIVVILNVQGSEADLQDKLFYLIQTIQAAVAKYLNISISAAFSKPVEHLKDIPIAYAHASELSQYRLVYGRQCIISDKLMDLEQNREYIYPEELEKDIIESIRLHNVDRIGVMVDKFFNAVAKLYHNDIIMSVSTLLYATIKDISSVSGKKDYKHRFRTLQKEIIHLDTLDDIKQLLLCLYKEVVTEMAKKSDNVKQGHIERIQKIIADEYRNPNLSSEEIAYRLGLSSSYIRDMFREMTNITLSDCINQTRCEKAKELLLDTSLTIVEISDKVGLANQNYFYTLFKKLNGMTPAQYRKIERLPQI